MCCVGLQDRSGFAAAVELASSSDIVIAVMGIDQSQEHETGMASVSLIIYNQAVAKVTVQGRRADTQCKRMGLFVVEIYCVWCTRLIHKRLIMSRLLIYKRLNNNQATYKQEHRPRYHLRASSISQSCYDRTAF